MSKIAVVTGGTSGIGRETALYLANHDCTVYELSRRAEGVAGLRHISADVTDELSVQAAVSQILAEAGRIDILVNSAGMGIAGAVEFTDTRDAQRQFNVNFFGMVRMCKAVLPLMRQNGAGRIVNIGSVAGVIPLPFQSYYAAAKAAVNSYTMSLANEVRPFGITVCALMPGDIRTGFTAAREKSFAGDDIYGGRILKSVSIMEKDERNGMPPEKVGAFAARLCLRKRVKPLCSLGYGYRLVCLLARILPSGVLNRIIGLLYAS